jgi:1-acyl-sn-glycerol-3-phosphate acyltransferase
MTYRLIRALLRASLAVFFRRVDVQFPERLPPREPVLLVANHTNAFVDGALLIAHLPREVTLTAKASLRKNPALAALLRALRVVALHRRQDDAGPAAAAENADAFRECRARLAGGGLVAIFPEGLSHSEPALQPFRSGAARIALDFVRALRRPLPILPTAILYEEKSRFRSAAGIVHGEPFDAAAWQDARPGRGAAELTAEIERRIRSLTENYASPEERALVRQAEEILRSVGRAPAPVGREEPPDLASRVGHVARLQAGAAWLQATHPGERERLEHRVAAVHRKAAHLGVRIDELFLPMDPARAAFFVLREAEILLVGLPLAALGALVHGPAYLATRAIVRRTARDEDHVATHAVFLGAPIFLLWYALQVAAAGVLFGPLPALGYALSAILAGSVALLWRDRAGSVVRRVRTFLLFARHPGYQRSLADEARAVAERIHHLHAELEHAESSRPGSL